MKKLCLLLLLMFLSSSNVLAALEFRSDFFSSYLIGGSNDLLIRSNNSILMGGVGLSFGINYLHDPLHSYITDSGYGGVIKFGDRTFFEMAGGYFERKYDDLKGRGFYLVLMGGRQWSNNFSVSIPIIIKRIASGDLEKRWMVDVIPYFGLRFKF